MVSYLVFLRALLAPDKFLTCRSISEKFGGLRSTEVAFLLPTQQVQILAQTRFLLSTAWLVNSIQIEPI